MLQKLLCKVRIFTKLPLRALSSLGVVWSFPFPILSWNYCQIDNLSENMIVFSTSKTCTSDIEQSSLQCHSIRRIDGQASIHGRVLQSWKVVNLRPTVCTVQLLPVLITVLYKDFNLDPYRFSLICFQFWSVSKQPNVYNERTVYKIALIFVFMEPAYAGERSDQFLLHVESCFVFQVEIL